MKKENEWYFEHQRRFKVFKRLENLSGVCSQQIINENSIIEEWILEKNGKPDLYKLIGTKINGCTKVEDPYGKQISITEIGS